MLIPGLSPAQTWHSTNQVTIAWDPAEMPDGAVGVLTYDVWIVESTAAKNTAVKATRVASPPATVTFDKEGKYFLGVQTVRIIAAGDEVSSTINWSDIAAGTGGNPFGVVYYAAPPAVLNLHLN